MELAEHRFPTVVLDSLAAGGGGTEATAQLVAGQRSKHRLLLMGILERSESAGPAFDVLVELAGSTPEAVDHVINYPATTLWARRTLRGLVTKSGDCREPARLGAVAAAAAVHARADCRVEIPPAGRTVMLPSVGELETGGRDTVSLEVRGGELKAGERTVTTTEPGQPGWSSLRRAGAAGGLVEFVIDDLDPHRWTDPAVLTRRLSPDEVRHWRVCVEEAWEILTRHHWTTAAEVRAILSTMVPILGPENGENSASSQETFGAMALSTPPDGRWLASTFAHEIQHSKLGALLDLLELTLPDDRRYYAPWRPDPRPISGLLQGAYAFMGVAGFWRRQRAVDDDLRAHTEFAHWRDSAFEVSQTLLDSRKLTPVGERFVTGMQKTLVAWLDEPAPPAALAIARRRADDHRAAWIARNG